MAESTEPREINEDKSGIWDGDLGEGVLSHDGDLGAIGGYMGMDSPIFAPPQAFSMPDEADLGDLAAFKLAHTPDGSIGDLKESMKEESVDNGRLTKEMMSLDIDDVMGPRTGVQEQFNLNDEPNPWNSMSRESSIASFKFGVINNSSSNGSSRENLSKPDSEPDLEPDLEPGSEPELKAGLKGESKGESKSESKSESEPELDAGTAPRMYESVASSSASSVSSKNGADFYQTIASSSSLNLQSTNPDSNEERETPRETLRETPKETPRETSRETEQPNAEIEDSEEDLTSSNAFYMNKAKSETSIKSVASSRLESRAASELDPSHPDHVHFKSTENLAYQPNLPNPETQSIQSSRPPSYTENPSENDSKMTHKRGPSQFEYFQAPTGSIEKVKVLDGESSDEDTEWQPMTTVGSYEVYDDKNNVVVELDQEDQENRNAAASGYTRVAEDDAVSVTSLDAETDFLFDAHAPEDEVDTEFQLNSTKQMLSPQQRIAYAGLCRLAIAEMADLVHCLGKRAVPALDALRVWGGRVGLKLYTHLELNNDEQLMIESLVEHRVLADDLTPCLKVVQHSTGEIFEAVDASSANVNELHQECRKVTTSLDVDVRWTVMCDLFLILLDGASYDARSRCLLVLIANKLGIEELDVCKFERKVTDVLELDESADQDWTENEIIQRRKKRSRNRKLAYVGLATVGGGLVIGLSAGLLAPVVGAGFASVLTTIGITGTSGFLAGAGGTAIITTAGTAIGARVGGKAMLRRAGHVKTFEFRPIFNNNRVNVVITVSGWLTGKDDDVRLPFSTIDPVVGDVLTVSWEPEMMRSLGQTINILATEALSMGVQQLLAATIMTTLMGALQAPMWLSKLSYLVDNPWSVSLDRAWAAGLILADTLMKRNLGSRPATLVGYSLGARVIYSCLAELARHKAYGLVQEVFLFGTPVFYNKKQFTGARSVVAGRFVNGYSRKDWILAFLFPASKRYGSVIGLDPVPGVENLDLSEHVDGHMAYRNKMPKLLALCGWAVTSEEFDEIEDPDPDRLREKQRTLLEELETNADEKPKKRMFWKLDWTQRAKTKDKPKEGTETEELFDIDAIRNEIGSLQPELIFDEPTDPDSKSSDQQSTDKQSTDKASASTSFPPRDPANDLSHDLSHDLPHDITEQPPQEHLASQPLTLPEFDEIEEPASTLDYDDADWRLRGLGRSKL